MDRDDDRGCSLALPRLCVRVELSGGEDTNIFGVEDRLCEAGEKFTSVFRAESDGEGVDGQLGIIGGKAQWQLHQQKKCLLQTDRHCVQTEEIRLEHPARPMHLDGPFHSLISRRNPG